MKFARIIVIDPNGPNAKMLANLLKGLNPSCQVYGSTGAEHALALARELNPDLIFVESTGPEIDGMKFARDLRRSDFACREAAMVMVSADATAGMILGARDAGIHEFLRRPYTMGDLQKRIDAVSGKPRDWIEAQSYVGPDRRRFNSGEFTGSKKRQSDAVHAEAMKQAG